MPSHSRGMFWLAPPAPLTKKAWDEVKRPVGLSEYAQRRDIVQALLALGKCCPAPTQGGHPLFPPQLIFRSLHGMAAGRPYSSSSTSQSPFEYFERCIRSPVLQMLLPPCKASPGAVQWVLHASCCSAWPSHHTNWSQHGLVGCAGTCRKGQPKYQRTGQLRRWTLARHSFSLTHICSFSTI